jgi:hypothetical protein
MTTTTDEQACTCGPGCACQSAADVCACGPDCTCDVTCDCTPEQICTAA